MISVQKLFEWMDDHYFPPFVIYPTLLIAGLIKAILWIVLPMRVYYGKEGPYK